DGTEVEARTVVCTIGTTVSPLLASLGLPRAYNRIKTQPDFRVEGYDNVWALGDCAAVPNAYDQKLAAPTAQVAVRQGKQLAANLLAVLAGRPTRPFSFRPLGMLASIGNHRAVGLVFGVKVSGFLAWFLWRGIYLSKMPTLARKIQIAFDWAWQLFFPRDIAELNLSQTERLGRAHYEAGQYVFHKGGVGQKVYVIERGRAGVDLDESAPPGAGRAAGGPFGGGGRVRDARRWASVKAEAPLDLLVMDQASFAQLAQHFEALRGPLERALQGRSSATEVLRRAKDHPGLDAGRVRDVMSSPVATLPVGL